MSYKEEYLGDGVYVCFDGYQLCLRAPREGGDHFVYLEPAVYSNLTDYVERLWLTLESESSNQGNNMRTYVAFYKKDQTVIQASSFWEAKQKAVEYFLVPKTKQNLISVVLADKSVDTASIQLILVG